MLVVNDLNVGDKSRALTVTVLHTVPSPRRSRVTMTSGTGQQLTGIYITDSGQCGFLKRSRLDAGQRLI